VPCSLPKEGEGCERKVKEAKSVRNRNGKGAKTKKNYVLKKGGKRVGENEEA